MKKLTYICLLLSLLTFGFSPPSFATVINFDDLPGNGNLITNVYNGFNWNNLSSNMYDRYNATYNNSLIPASANNFISNADGNFAGITKASANNFIFNGAYLTGWAQNDATAGFTAKSLTMDGYLSGNLVATYVANLTVDSSMIYYATGWSSPMDKVVFTPNAGLKFFLMDNLNYSDLIPLTVKIIGAGNGSVISTPQGIACGATCSTDFTVNASMSLNASAFDYSIFTGWTGTICSGTGVCSFTLTAPTTIGANFDIDNAHSVRTDGQSQVYYPSLQHAFDSAPSGAVGAWGMTFSETLSLSRAITINLHGGQNVGYTAQTGMTTIKGMVTIVKGCLVVDRVTIM